MSALLVEAWVPGKARPKGSLKVANRQTGWMKESNPASKPWRQKMAERLVTARGAGATCDVPVDVTCRVYYPRPAGLPLHIIAPSESTGAYAKGDIDKIARNLLDALQDPHGGSPAVLADDALVQDLRMRPCYALPGKPHGVWVRVEVPTLAELLERAFALSYELEHDLHRLGLLEETGF